MARVAPPPHSIDSDQEEEYIHEAPTKIPYIIVSTLIFLAYFGYFFTHFFLETRPHILEQGTSSHTPYYLPQWLQPPKTLHMTHNNQATPTYLTILQYLWFFSPFSLHPLQWITFIAISYCFLVSFLKVRFVSPGVIESFDPKWGFHKYPPQIQQQLAFQSAQGNKISIMGPTVERKHDGSLRYCQKLNVFKPDRSHYCGATHRVVKRFDHYCVFLYASVGYNNHKYFILFLIWLIQLSLFIGIKAFYALEFNSGLGGAQLVVNLLLACFGVAVGMALVGFLCFHLYLITNSLTTLEFNEKYGKIDPYTGKYKMNPFNCGIIANLRQVFGHGSILTWLLPIDPIRLPYEDGTVFLNNLPAHQQSPSRMAW